MTLPWRLRALSFPQENLSSKLKVAGSNPAGVATIVGFTININNLPSGL